MPFAIVPTLVVNGLFGAACGACAVGLQRLRGINR
jgi:hypothetical protein